jgi:DNA polymerase I-like protein with 3'-5' exonuclease and polymerase domains
VGCAFHFPGMAPFYLAWGHPVENNCTVGEAKEWLHKAWGARERKLFHNAKFDLAVSYEQMGMPHLPWDQIDDTMFLAYLADPHSHSLGLKELAVDFLNEPATERDVLREWIIDHSDTLLAAYPWNKDKPGTRKITPSKTGAWIFATPGKLCGDYAIGDVTRTRGLFEELWPLIADNGMEGAYNRERQLLPILMENEETGMRTDLPLLEVECEGYGNTFDYVEDWLRKRLKASGLNFDADADVADILVTRGIVDEVDFARTKPTKAHPNGQLSMSKDNLLPEMFKDQQIAQALGYRNRLATCLKMFMRPWRDQAREMNGYITTNWNQTRGSGGGTRTGRPSTDKHNFLNISKDFTGRDDGYQHPAFLEVAPLPLCRKYILPDEGEVFLHRDFSGQELRVFAHFEQGHLFDQYQANPRLDPHAFIGDELKKVAGREIERTKIKVMNFQSLYGGGIPALQNKLRCGYGEAKELKAYHNAALPGRVILNEEIKRIVQQGLPIRTWGGRLYFPEPPGEDGRSKVYKLINYEIQGSAADLTKQSLIDWHAARDRFARFLVTVYDEINISAAPDREEREMRLLREVMEADRLSVPMLSDGKRGPNWGALTKCD